VYSELLTERKIERIRRTTKLPRVVIRGVWVTLLAMANDSPQRGVLLWAEGVPVTTDELCDDLEMDRAELDALMAEFETLHMIGRQEEIIECTNFGKRQFKSDSSTDRVRRHRAKKQAATQAEAPPRNVSVTFPCNGPDTDTETELETDTETDDNAPSTPPSPSTPPTPAEIVFEKQFGPFVDAYDRQEIVNAVTESGEEKVIAAIKWARRNRIQQGVIQSICTAASRWQFSTGPPGDNGRGDRSSDATVQAIEELRAEIDGKPP